MTQCRLDTKFFKQIDPRFPTRGVVVQTDRPIGYPTEPGIYYVSDYKGLKEEHLYEYYDKCYSVGRYVPYGHNSEFYQKYDVVPFRSSSQAERHRALELGYNPITEFQPYKAITVWSDYVVVDPSQEPWRIVQLVAIDFFQRVVEESRKYPVVMNAQADKHTRTTYIQHQVQRCFALHRIVFDFSIYSETSLDPDTNTFPYSWDTCNITFEIKIAGIGNQLRICCPINEIGSIAATQPFYKQETPNENQG